MRIREIMTESDLHAEPSSGLDPISRQPTTNYLIVTPDGTEVGRVPGRFANSPEAALAYYRRSQAAPSPVRPAPAPPAPAASKPRREAVRVAIEAVPVAALDRWAEDDGYLYHVTTEPKAAAILRAGFKPSQPATMTNYEGYSAGKVFFTGRAGLPFWLARVEQHLESNHDDPPEIAVLRVPLRSLDGILKVDEVGSRDATEAAFFVTRTVLPGRRAGK